MSEPKVEFDLQNVDPNIREMFDQLRRWYEFREDVRTPSMQAFEAEIADQETVNLYVPGHVFGAVGMTEVNTGEWKIMLATTDFGVCHFLQDADNVDDNYVTVKNNSSSKDLGYRVTVFYRDA